MSHLAGRLPPEVNRILFVKNLPYAVTTEQIYDLFGKYGAIYQVRLGNTKETKGTGYVVYEDIFDAKSACEHLSGFGLQGRYLIVTYYQAGKMAKRLQNERIQREIDEAMLAKRQPTTNNATDPNTTA